MNAPALGLPLSVANMIRPVPPRNSYELVKKIRTPPNRPFNTLDYPWVKGICEAFDDPEVRVIALQMAARLGKSMTAQALLVSAMLHSPDVAMIAQSTATLLEQTVEDKYYKILENTNATRNLIPPSHARNKKEVSFAGNKIYGAWSGSTTTLADKPPKYKHAGEIDKWEFAKSREADSLKLFMQRGIEIPDRKSIIESTPDLKHTSRIEKYLLKGWNARFLVPCPKCGDFIQLIPGDGENGGVIFDKLNKKWSELHSYRTARYQCQLCGDEWSDMYRKPAIRQGLWVPEGCRVERFGKSKSKAKVVGEMSGDPEIASFQLSRLYAPTFKFGDIAKQLTKCHIDPDEWQDTNNSWLGITHAHRRAQFTWEETAERLAMDYRLHTVPINGIFLTCGIDVQLDRFVFIVVAWGRHGKGWLVDYGDAYSIEELKKVVQTKYEHADGGPRIGISLSLIDSGEGLRQDEIFDIAKLLNREKGPWVWPSKGSKSGLQSGKAYKKQSFDEMDDKKQRNRRFYKTIGFFHITVNTPWTQTWINRALFFKKPGEAKSIAVPQEIIKDEDLFSQLINEKREGVDTTSGHGNHRWVVVDESIPWDFRDSLRYAKCGAELFIKSAWIRLPLTRRITSNAKPRPPKPKKPAAPKPRKPAAKKEGFVRSVRKSGASRFINRRS